MIEHLELTLASLGKAKGGLIDRMFRQAQNRIAMDLRAAPDIPDKRKLVISLLYKPTVDDGELGDVVIEIDVGHKHGWPDYLRVRHVQILDLLYEQGPHTREQIGYAIGWRIERGQRHLLASKYGRGSYLADLMAAGFVVRSRGRCVRKDRKGKSVYQYFCAVHVVRNDPSTWPDKEWAIGQVYGNQSESGNGGSAAAAVAGRTDLPGEAAGGGGREHQRSGRPSGRRGDRPKSEGRRQGGDRPAVSAGAGRGVEADAHRE